MAISVEKLSDACGAEIKGVDLREKLSEDDKRVIEDAFHENVVVVFRDQGLQISLVD